ncbi:glycogen debranching N-terminal domain-containing protein [Micromonospora inyonensis]|uniref:glycogen debranching N-terminal domain-containing protein n=1 Tax=Micromonospora inyonensis TaxID=47866 RepID=UPI000A4F3623|nr:glycogen debranching N-terminal domain-containing protein [Micromonospora inyonensis]
MRSPCVNATIRIDLERAGDILSGQITVTNYAPERVDLLVRLTIETDFADLAEVRLGEFRPREGIVVDVGDDRLRSTFERGHFRRQVTVYSSQPAQVDVGGMIFHVSLGPGEDWGAMPSAGTTGPAPAGRCRTRERAALTPFRPARPFCSAYPPRAGAGGRSPARRSRRAGFPGGLPAFP